MLRNGDEVMETYKLEELVHSILEEHLEPRLYERVTIKVRGMAPGEQADFDVREKAKKEQERVEEEQRRVKLITSVKFLLNFLELPALTDDEMFEMPFWLVDLADEFEDGEIPRDETISYTFHEDLGDAKKLLSQEVETPENDCND